LFSRVIDRKAEDGLSLEIEKVQASELLEMARGGSWRWFARITNRYCRWFWQRSKGADLPQSRRPTLQSQFSQGESM